MSISLKEKTLNGNSIMFKKHKTPKVFKYQPKNY